MVKHKVKLCFFFLSKSPAKIQQLLRNPKIIRETGEGLKKIYIFLQKRIVFANISHYLWFLHAKNVMHNWTQSRIVRKRKLFEQNDTQTAHSMRANFLNYKPGEMRGPAVSEPRNGWQLHVCSGYNKGFPPFLLAPRSSSNGFPRNLPYDAYNAH